MRNLCLVFLLVLCVGLAGCSTKSSFVQMAAGQPVETTADYSVGDVKDSSGFKFKEGDKDVFDIPEAMRSALQTALNSKGALGSPGMYTLNVDILKYEPGNAGLRWLVPGAGATKVGIVAVVVDKEGKHLARIPVDRTIAAGGAFTIGAWKYAFDEVATELVEVLKDSSKRKPPKDS